MKCPANGEECYAEDCRPADGCEILKLTHKIHLSDEKSVDAILAERHETHGNYDDDARCAIKLLHVLQTEFGIRSDRHQLHLTAVQEHALGMILHKIARIVTGDPNFKDHWLDISGYAKLVADRCR